MTPHNPHNSTTVKMNTTQSTQRPIGKDLMKVFQTKAREMLDTKHLTTMLKSGMKTDIKVGDYVISSRAYDGSIFTITPLGTEQRPKPNPYQEIVKRSSVVNLTVKAMVGDEGSKSEMRIKARKLNLLGWDERTQCFPIQSDLIIFRQEVVNPRTKYYHEVNFWTNLLTNYTLNAERKKTAEENLAVLNDLIRIPPFVCFGNNKYGILFKTELNITRIVREHTAQIDLPSLENAKVLIEGEVEKKCATLVDKHQGSRADRREAIPMAVFHPDRVERMMEKHGDDYLDVIDPV